ncbi:anti-repressor SinI family protein [Siminovitchia sp. FSL H7-0308]|uniref:DNA-binding anti-repressor SinI n=1 Tax=unclassified Siminovitchia TaxID=2837530 RepID=UPI0009F95402
MREAQNRQKNSQKLDSEWVTLLMEAKRLNITPDEIRRFLNKKSKTFQQDDFDKKS